MKGKQDLALCFFIPFLCFVVDLVLQTRPNADHVCVLLMTFIAGESHEEEGGEEEERR